MYKIQIFNHIASQGLARFSKDQYETGGQIQEPDAVLLRSHNLHDYSFPNSVKAVARAGAGVNNIPVEKLTRLGIPVFNTPGANANAVKELVLAAMLIASRHLCQAWGFVRGLAGQSADLEKQVEAGKKQFSGVELNGRKLGVIGLGAIGVRVANAALALDMEVVGFDPNITVHRAWQLSSSVQQALSIEALLSDVDYVTVHVPLLAATKHLLNASRLKLLKPGAVILNFARAGIVDEAALLTALNHGQSLYYATDFPEAALIAHPNVLAFPHLGASTVEAEENCAVMAVSQLCNFLESGNIRCSVNFPEAVMPLTPDCVCRLAVVNENIPNMVGQISTALAQANLNIVDLLNKSQGEIAYTLIDINQHPNADTLAAIRGIKGVLSLRVIEPAKKPV